MAHDLITLLKNFNRKERFFLIGQVLGNKGFTLSQSFRDQIGEKLSIEIPVDSFVAMDFHLDWIYATLLASTKESLNFIEPNPLKLNSNQEDIDLFIAFKQNENYHLILIEAKAETGWTNKQLSSKSTKLKAIFGEDKCIWKNIIPHFLITSPRKPRDLKIDLLPLYLQKSMDEIWFQLHIPNDLTKITRCNDIGKSSINGNNWKNIIA